MTLNVNIDMYLGCDVTNPTKKKERWRICARSLKTPSDTESPFTEACHESLDEDALEVSSKILKEDD